MINAIAIDDEPLALDVIKTFCSKSELIQLKDTFTEPTQALKYLRKYPVDLLFLDVRMPAMSGLELYKAISQNTMVIFTTAYSEYAVDGFNLSAVDYLLKPIEYERFLKAAQKASEYYKYQHGHDELTDQYLFVRIDYSLVKIPVADIVYVEGVNNYIKIHMKEGKQYLVRMSMKGIEEKLPEKQFLRVHRSYIVSLQYIQSIRNKNIHIDDVLIPIGVNYEGVLDKLQNK